MKSIIIIKEQKKDKEFYELEVLNTHEIKMKLQNSTF